MFNPLLDLTKDTDRYDGFYRGVVVDVDDPLQSGRVRVKVHPMFSTIDDVEVIPWAIPADPMFGGSSNTGGTYIPSLDSHVFVFFENGDFRFPVYFASAPAISNGESDIPTLSRKDDGTVSSIDSSRSKGVSTASGGTWDEPASAYAAKYPNNKVYRSKKGILIEIDDTDDNVRLHFYHPSGTRTEINDSGQLVHHVVDSLYEVVIKDEYIEVKGKQDTTVKKDYGLKVVGNGVISIGGNYDITVSGNVTLNASGSVTVTGSSISLN